MTLHPETQEIIHKLAQTPEGRIALAQLIQYELREISRHISGAATRCEVEKILKEINKEPSNQNQGIQKEEDPFDSWFAEHYPDIDKLGKDDPLAAGFRYAMRSKFNSGRNFK